MGILQDNLVLSLRRRANARNVSFRISLRWLTYIVNSVDKTKLFSLDSLSAGQVLGFSANPRNTNNFDTKKHLPNPSTNTSNDYTSQAWETTITNTSNAHNPVKQPTNANRVQTLLQPARQTSQTSQDQPSDQTPEGRPPSQMFISAL